MSFSCHLSLHQPPSESVVPLVQLISTVGVHAVITWLTFSDVRVTTSQTLMSTTSAAVINVWIIRGSDRRPETKQGIEGKIVRFRSGRVRDRVRDN